MRNIGRRVIKLGRLPQFTRPPSPFQQIQSMALEAMSDEHLESLSRISIRQTSGVETSLNAAETAAEAAYRRKMTKGLAALAFATVPRLVAFLLGLLLLLPWMLERSIGYTVTLLGDFSRYAH